MPDASGTARHAARLARAVALHQVAREAGWAYRFDRAVGSLRAALRLLDTLAADSEAVVLRIRVLVSLGYAQAESGSHTGGLARLDEAAEHLRLLPDGLCRSELDGLVLGNRGLLLHRAGRIVEGIELFDEAIARLAEGRADGTGAAAADPVVLASAYLNRGHAYIDLAQAVPSARDFTSCLRVCDEHGIDWLAAKARHNLGYVAYMTGDLPTALHHYAETERSYRTATTGLLPALHLDRARALLAAGLAGDAARQLEEAVPRLRRQRAGQDLAEAEVVLAGAALLDGNVLPARR